MGVRKVFVRDSDVVGRNGDDGDGGGCEWLKKTWRKAVLSCFHAENKRRGSTSSSSCASTSWRLPLQVHKNLNFPNNSISRPRLGLFSASPHLNQIFSVFRLGVKQFQFKQRSTYKFRYKIVNFGGHSPEDVTAALSSSDKKIMTNMKEIIKRYQLFLANFKVKFIKKRPAEASLYYRRRRGLCNMMGSNEGGVTGIVELALETLDVHMTMGISYRHIFKSSNEVAEEL
ncbi:recQ-mediated genome instability protein 1 isoform X2 [Cinnamomum micranthum f. kanehirae]|uniref:RecQ-mediated genome instability protein 1 isoform X2 n=1 Tax=Cinnamomum micranthum f. kanehirae TaxID=337451 RepID=A0A3S4N6A8_9MAGN|nr:recQ-mediated genome instability protein 1 isoform X2 [Cinnamomum micranthum f. kanehirae]